MNLEQLKNILKLLLPKETVIINKLLSSLKTFFSKEDISITIDNLKNLLVWLEYLNKKIKDKEITKIIKSIKRNIKNVITALGKQDMNNVTIFQQLLIQLIEELTDNLNIVYARRTPFIEKEYIIEASSYFRKQRRKTKDFKVAEISDSIEKIKLFANADKISSRPQFAEPRCYGGAPLHLNSVVMGKASRLVFYMHPDEKSNIIRICLYVSEGMHNKAWDALQTNRVLESNFYWRIATKLKKYKILRTHFVDFKKINPETLADL